MKRTLTALSLTALATVSFAATEVITNTDLDRSLPTYPEIAEALYRVDAGQSDQDAVVRTPVADAKYRFDAGESFQDAVVSDVG